MSSELGLLERAISESMALKPLGSELIFRAPFVTKSHVHD